MNKTKKSVSIKSKILIPSSFLILFISLLYTAIQISLGLFTSLTDNAYKALYYPVENRSDEISAEMRLTALKVNEIAGRINSKINSEFDIDKIFSNNAQDKKVLNSILNFIFPEILRTTKMLNTSGVFLVLNTSIYNDGVHKAGIRIMDSEPEVINSTNADLLYSRGPSDILLNYKLPMDSYWSFEYDFSGDPYGNLGTPELNFFWKPFKISDRLPDTQYDESGYWSKPYKLSGSENKCVTYSVALRDNTGHPYGVFGIDLSEDYLAKKLPAKEIGYKNSFYIIGSFNQETGALYKNQYIGSGNASSKIISTMKDKDVLKPVHDAAKYGLLKMDLKDKYFSSIFAKPEQLSIYNGNSLFKEEKWYLIGFAPSKEVSFAIDKTIFTLIFSFVSTLVLGIITIYYATQKYTKQIIGISERVKNHSYNKPIILEKTGIREIDDLSSALELATTEVMFSGKRLSLTMDLVDARIGCFEHNLEAGMVFLTDSLFNMLGIKKTNNTNNLISEAIWGDIVGVFPDYKNEFEYNNIEAGSSKWLRIKTALTEKRVLGIIMDITSEVNQRKQLEKERDYDVLTGLYNRRAFQVLVSKILNEKPEAVGALLFIDLDNLKYINDVYGHDIGDKYIKCAAENVKQFKQSNAVIARISGDEFAIFLHGFTSKEEIRELIKEKIANFTSTLRLPDNSVQKVRSSMGVAFYPYDSNEFSTLIKYADFAMYEVKHTYKGRIKEFNKVSFEKDYYLINKSEAFNELIDKELIYFVFQPIVDVDTVSVYGYEALLRPGCKDFRTPYEILNIARTHAKLYEIEKLTTFGVLKFMKNCSSELQNKKIFFNSISNQALSDEDISNIEKNYLSLLASVVVEFTEEERIDSGTKNRMMALFERHGGELAIDDFGAGYSNESSLIIISPHYIKIDMSLTRNIDRDTNKQQLVANIIKYGQDHGIKIIAEGVETFDEMRTLVSLKIDYLQGFYLRKPLSKLVDIPDNIKNEIKKAKEMV